MKSLYGNTAPKAAPKPPAPTRKSIYSAGAPGAGSIENAVDSCFSRIEAGYRDDPERLQQLRDTRKRLTRVFEERNVTPADAHAMLSTYREHEAFKHSPESLAQRWPSQWDTIRKAAGSTEAGEKVLADANKFYAAIAQADPAFAHTAKANGSVESAQVIQAAANYADPPATPAAATA